MVPDSHKRDGFGETKLNADHNLLGREAFNNGARLRFLRQSPTKCENLPVQHDGQLPLEQELCRPIKTMTMTKVFVLSCASDIVSAASQSGLNSGGLP